MSLGASGSALGHLLVGHGRPPDAEVGYSAWYHRAMDDAEGRALARSEPGLAFIAAAVALAVAMGVGRFVYTPLLVVMLKEGSLSRAFAGVLAAANLAGYLLGALMAMHSLASRHRTTLVRVGSVVVVVMTAMMALPSSVWLPARFITGVASGLVFVLTVSLVLDLAARVQSKYGIATAFSGVGIGIAAAGVLALPFQSLGGARAAWLGLAGISAIALSATLAFLPPSCSGSQRTNDKQQTSDGPLFGWLALLYGVEGAAYIIPATFLVAMVAETAAIARLGAIMWILVGLVAAPSTLWWNAASKRWGNSAALVVACTVQIASMLAPFVLPGGPGALALAVGLGGTFIGIASLAMALARSLRPKKATAAIGLLTALYGVGQIAGPLVATRVVLDTGSYRFALFIAAIALALATAPFAAIVARSPER
mgnify:CR=1 FL=1